MADVFVAQVAALKVSVGVLAIRAARKAVAAVFRHHVHVEPAAWARGRRAARLEHDFLDLQLVEHIAVRARHRMHRVDGHAIHSGDADAGAVDGQPRRLLASASAVVTAAGCRAGAVLRAQRQPRKRLKVLGGGHRIEDLPCEHVLRARVLHVDDRAGGVDGDGLFQTSDSELGIDCRRKRPCSARCPPACTGLNPGSVKVTAYTPGRRSTILYWPRSSVTAVRIFSMSAGLDASTVTPGRIAPVASVASPAMPPLTADCAEAPAVATSMIGTETNRTRQLRVMGFLRLFEDD